MLKKVRRRQAELLKQNSQIGVFSMRQRFATFFFIIMVPILFVANVAASDIEGQFLSSNGSDSKYSRIINDPALIAAFFTGQENSWLITVRKRGQQDSLPQYYLSFFLRSKNGNYRKKYEYRTVNTFQTVYSTIEKDRLMSIWTTGSAHRLIIFSIGDTIVKEVLSEGWKREPEFVHLTADIEPEIIIPIDEEPGKEPKYGAIYEWRDNRYILVKKALWKDRLMPLYTLGDEKK
jgi:hypothetical protein